MARDPLHVLLALRRWQAEQAKQALGVCLRDEADAASGVKLLDEARARDREAAGTMNDAYGFGEMFANRLDVLRELRRAADAKLSTAHARSTEARDRVVDAQTAKETVETVLDERNAEAAASADRQAQHALDDMTRTRRGAGRDQR